MSENICNKSLPTYTIQNIEQFPLNPYREFVHFCETNIYPNIEKTKYSLHDIFLLSTEEKNAFVQKIETILPDAKLKIIEKPSHQRIFLEFNLIYKEHEIGNLIFYTHLSYLSNNSVSDNEFYAAELDFTEFDGLDFLNMNKSDNILDFVKDGEDKDTVDMIIAHIKGLCEFTEFIKYFKTKSLAVKNIELFSKQLIKPYVSDIQVIYTPVDFVIGVLCGENIHKRAYPYENYLTSIKEFSKAILDKYGEQFKQIENKE